MRGRQTKKGRRENGRDLGVVEWRTPVGRAERAGDREGKREMQVQTEGKRERENDGEREKNRRAEERTREERGKEEGRGNARGGGETASRKGGPSRARPPVVHATHAVDQSARAGW
jgi:hypothetical protein